MISLTYRRLRNPAFFQAARKLATAQSITDPKDYLNVALIYKYILEHWIESDKGWQAIGKKYSIDGKDPEQGQEIAIDPELKDQFEKDAGSFYEHPALINRPLLRLDIAQAAELSPAELITLEDLFEMPKEAV